MQPETSLPSSRMGSRRFLIACGVGGLINMVVFAWMVTSGTWNFLPQPSFATGYYTRRAVLYWLDIGGCRPSC